MRDFRDAKTMAQTLRESLTAKAFTISHSESLELVSKMLGVADWNTLSALLQAQRRDSGRSGRRAIRGSCKLPRDSARGTSFLSRPRPIRFSSDARRPCLRSKDAFERQREVVLAVQRHGAVDEPDLRMSTRSACSPSCLKLNGWMKAG